MKYPLLLTVIWLLLIILVNPIGDFPLNDDWQYAYPVQQMVEEEQFEMQGQFAPNILLQVIYGYISCEVFGGFSFTYLRLGVLLLGLVCGLLLFHWLQKEGITKGKSFGVSLVLLSSPLFFSLSYTFMTDVPFLLLSMLCLYFFNRYIEEGRLSSLGFASLVAVAAYTIRQPGILFLLGFAVYVIVDQRRRKDRWLTASLLIAVGVLAYAGMEKWLKPILSITDNYVPVANIYFTEVFSNPLTVINTWASRFLKTFIYIGVFTLPLAPFLWGKLREVDVFRRSSLFITLAINIALFGLTFLAGKTFPFGGNLWFNWGLGPELLKDVYTLSLNNTPRIHDGWLYALQILGQLQISAILLLLWKTWHERSPSNQSFIIWLILMNGLYLGVISIFSYFDRFTLLCLVSCLYILSPWLNPPDWRFRWAAAIPFTLLLYFSFFATKDYLNWNRARAAAYAWLEQEGISIEQVDAGYEYNGWYNYHRHPLQSEGRSFWWVTAEDYLITFGPVQAYKPIQEFPYYRYLWWKKDQIWVLQREK